MFAVSDDMLKNEESQMSKEGKTPNINYQILGSIGAGYGFLPNFSPPNDQSSFRIRKRNNGMSPLLSA